MTAKRNKPKSRVSDEMAAEVVLDPQEQDEAAPTDDDDRKVPRRPQEATTPPPAKSTWDKAEQFARMFASVGVVTAAGLGLWEYKTSNDDVRRERSLEIVRDWQSEQQIDRYTRVQSFVEQRLATSDAISTSLPPEALEKAYSNLGYRWTTFLRASDGPGARQTEEDIDRLTLYFGQMEICISSGLCDAAVLRAYFESEVVTFWRYFSGYATLRREANYSGYGAPVEELVARFGTMKAE